MCRRPLWRSRGTTHTLTTRRVDGVPQLGVLPLAQLVLLGASGGFGGLNLRTSETRSRAKDAGREPQSGSAEFWDAQSFDQ